MMVLYSKKHKKLENFYKFFVFVLTKEMFLFIMYIKTLKRRKLFNQYRDISIGERNEKETFEYGLGVFTLRSIYLD